MRPVSEILARVTAGPDAAVTLPSQRSAFTVAAAAAIGAGTAAASMTGSFPAIHAPTLPGFSDTQSFAKIVEPAAQAAALPTRAPAPAAATPLAPSVAGAPRSASSVGAPAGTVTADDLHQSDARQIAALSRAVDMGKAASAPSGVAASSGQPAQSVAGVVKSAVDGVGQAVGSALSLPSMLGGVPVSGMAANLSAAGAVKQAASKLGKPYVWGATGPSAFDCSGLMQWAYKQLGVSLPRTSAAQSQFGTPVSKSELRPGDLVFFYSPVSHVGMYLGNGKILHASEPGQPVKVSDMSRFPFHNARRV
jgi:cell wall-associated NlpC family hydrolase